MSSKGWDVGDVLGAEGTLFKTRTGELSVKADTLRCSSSHCGPCPTSGTASPTVEQRYRQRYVDLIVTRGCRDVFRSAHAIVAACARSSTRATSSRSRRR
jgi:lysyl-tRNA synthetase class 2